ncbi:MAG: hypothetical protein WBP08_02835 [Saprospiraceae bacterium]|nr:hypothetical protein [Saprospiraceae bacterium]
MENIDEKDQDNPINTAQESPPTLVIPTSVTETVTQNPKTENLEVYHHGHHHAHHEAKRSRKSYFWEFLMLFLAVLCGSLAEYWLDHKIENDREEQFIITMIGDLKEDISLLAQSIIKFEQKGIEVDSLTILLNSPNKKAYGSDLYYYGRLVSRFDFFTSTDHTIKQMENSGDFRLIKNMVVATSISHYYSEMNALYLLQNNTNEMAMEYRSLAYAIFNPLVFESMVNDETKNVIYKPAGNPQLISYDASTIRRLSSMLHYMKGSRLVLYDRYIYLSKKATALIELLEKDYRLK